MSWFIYIAECKDSSLYTGFTTDVTRRINEHNLDPLKGAKCLKGKLPVKLVYKEEFSDKITALKREREIKGWRREKKLNLIKRKNEQHPEKGNII